MNLETWASLSRVKVHACSLAFTFSTTTTSAPPLSAYPHSRWKQIHVSPFSPRSAATISTFRSTAQGLPVNRATGFNELCLADAGSLIACGVCIASKVPRSLGVCSSVRGFHDNRASGWSIVDWLQRPHCTPASPTHQQIFYKKESFVYVWKRLIGFEGIPLNKTLSLCIKYVSLYEDERGCELCRPNWLWGSPNLLSNRYRGLFPRGWGGRGVKLTTYLHLVPRSRIRGSIYPLPP
jgi:hypothetical protein